MIRLGVQLERYKVFLYRKRNAANAAMGNTTHADAQQTSLSSDDVISRQQVDTLDALINKSDTSLRLIPYLYANI